uniref:ARAD1D21736p n=1 Tax=Blastobotrys adeninivorans TaxID=409370 RepID=A0A060T9U4_BLAAD
MTGSSKAFYPIKVGQMELKHRVAMAPLTRMRAHEKTFVLPDFAKEYYEQRASRPGTLLVTEGTVVSPAAGGFGSIPGVYSQEQLEQWGHVFDAIHAKGSYVFCQICGIGRQAEEKVIGPGNVVGPSDISKADGDPTRALTLKEIEQYIGDFVTASKKLVEAGADGVEIHAANGYFLDQFLHSNSNQRTDKYGGSIENRARLVLEVIDAVSEAIGPDRTAVRLSPWGQFGDMDFGISPIPQWAYMAQELEKRRRNGKELAYVHLVEPRADGGVDRAQMENESNDFFRLIYGGIIMLAGGLGDWRVIEHLTDKDAKLVIAVGRYFISNPDLVDRIEHRIPLTKYDRATFYTKGTKGYTDYHFAAKTVV